MHTVSRILKNVAKAAVYCNLWFGLCVALFYLGNCFYLGFEADTRYALLLCSGTVLIYSLPTLLLWKQREGNNFLTPKQQWAFNNPLLFNSGLMTAGIAIIVFLDSLGMLLLLLPTAFLAAAYLFPILPTRKGFKKIREIPLFKNLMLAMAFLWCCVMVPMVQNGVWDFSLLAFQFILLFSISLAFDFRDIDRDKLFGLDTLLVRLGPKLGIQFIGMVNYGLLGVTAFLCFMTGGLKAWALVIYLPFHVVAFHFATRTTWWPYYLTVIDSLLFGQALLIWLVLSIFA